MYSPPKEKIPGYGSSRSMGGILRSRAQGNTFNMADADAVWDDMNAFPDDPVQKPVKGTIHIYLSDLSPPEVDISKSSFIAKVYDIKKVQTIQAVIQHGSRDYSPLRRKYVLYLPFNN